MKITSIIVLPLLFPCVVAGQGWNWQHPDPQSNTLKDVYILNANTAIAVGNLGTVITTYDAARKIGVKGPRKKIKMR